MPQTNYLNLADGLRSYAGALVNAAEAEIYSGYNTDTVILPFGAALVKGTGDRDLILPVNGSSVLMGIAYATDTFEMRPGYSLNADNVMGYPLANMVSYVRKGVISVRIDGPVTAGQTGWWRHTATGAERRGNWRADADTSDAVQVPQSRFLRSGVAGDIVPLSINLP
jgi:hypothetical protein